MFDIVTGAALGLAAWYAVFGKPFDGKRRSGVALNPECFRLPPESLPTKKKATPNKKTRVQTY